MGWFVSMFEFLFFVVCLLFDWVVCLRFCCVVLVVAFVSVMGFVLFLVGLRLVVWVVRLLFWFGVGFFEVLLEV